MSEETIRSQHPFASGFARLLLTLLWVATVVVTLSNAALGLILNGVTIVLLLLILSQHRAWPSTTKAGRATLLFFLIGAIGMITFAENPWWRYVVIGLGILVIQTYLNHASKHAESDLRGRTALFVVTVSLMMWVVSVLSARIFVALPWWTMFIIGAFLGVASAGFVWAEAGVSRKTIRQFAPFFAVFGAEMMMSAWWLPTHVLIGGIIVTTATMLVLQSCRHVWQDTWTAGRGRRYLVIASAVIAVVLLTARWI